MRQIKCRFREMHMTWLTFSFVLFPLNQEFYLSDCQLHQIIRRQSSRARLLSARGSSLIYLKKKEKAKLASYLTKRMN
jgi:hypothetical protein